jgi:hypothetical protein
MIELTDKEKVAEAHPSLPSHKPHKPHFSLCLCLSPFHTRDGPGLLLNVFLDWSFGPRRQRRHKHASLDTAKQCPRKHAWPRAGAALRLFKEAVEDRPRWHAWAGAAGIVSLAHGHEV